MNLNEKVSKALQKRMKAMRSKMECADCGCRIPVYPGRYAKECPECGAVLKEKKVENKENPQNLTPWQQFTQNNAIKG